MTQWWLSFADERGFRGVAIVEAPTFREAVTKAWQLGINPGGEIRFGKVFGYGPEYCNRLLTRAEAKALAERLEN